MTDITELAQRMKAAAEKATPGEWVVQLGDEVYATDDGVDFEQVAIATLDARDADFIALANPANIRALVEALEKAQQVDEELCRLLPPGVEYMDPPDGGDVTPLEGVRRMVADYRQRIAELESHKSALLKFIRDSCYVFDGADEDISDAYVDAITSGIMPKLGAVAACNPPLFWVRVKSDGGYEGPVHDSQLEDVRKKSGEWLPLTLASGIANKEDKDKLLKELKNQVDYLQKIAHEQNELATKASNENASLTVMHGKALKHIDSLEKDLVPVYQFIMNNHHKEGYIEWCDCNKQYYETVNEEERRIVYSNVGVELQTVPPVTYFENDDAYQCRKWAWQQVKDEVTTEGWTSGDNATFFSFFCWGWDMRRQYNEQRHVSVRLPKTMYTEFDDDDYCREIAVLEKHLVIDCLTNAGIKVEAE
ncbi:TPA: ead/Ea22-like family protein [Klebsiella pneumoniae]